MVTTPTFTESPAARRRLHVISNGWSPGQTAVRVPSGCEMSWMRTATSARNEVGVRPEVAHERGDELRRLLEVGDADDLVRRVHVPVRHGDHAGRDAAAREVDR